MVIPLLDAIAIKGKTLSVDALLTQRKFAEYMVHREADYHFTVKNNQPTLREDIALFFENRQKPDFIDHTPPDHGRNETCKIWITTALNQYLDSPHVGQAFVIERESIEKKTGERTHEVVYGITSSKPEKANAEIVIKTNREHWSIEKALTGKDMNQLTGLAAWRAFSVYVLINKSQSRSRRKECRYFILEYLSVDHTVKLA